MFGKKEEVKPQVDLVPESGKEVSMSEQEMEKLREIKQVQEEAREEAKRLGKFFSLEIGEKTRIIVNFAKTETFKVKTKSGDLVDQFRYEVIDARYPDRVKQFDTWHNVSEAIVHNVENGHTEMEIRCLKNQMGGRKYVIVPYDEE